MSDCLLYLELIPKAVTKARLIPAINLYGFFLVTMKYINGSTTNPCINRPVRTVTINIANIPTAVGISSMSATLVAIKLHIPIGAYLSKILTYILQLEVSEISDNELY